MTGGEVLAEKAEELDFDYEKFRDRLIPEWQKRTNQLAATNRGREALNDPNFRHFTIWNSWEIDQFSRLVEEGHVDPTQLTNAETDYLYNMHTSLIDMNNRTPSLKVIAESAILRINEFDKTDPKKAQLKRRQLASILEEISHITSGDEGSEYAVQAYEVNSEVIKTKLLDFSSSPRKVHAQFSKFDIRKRSLVFGPHIDSAHVFLTDKSREEQARVIQAEGFEQLGKTIDTVLHPLSHSETYGADDVRGSFGALLVLKRLDDRIWIDGKTLEIEASNSYMRQDHKHIGRSFIDTKDTSTKNLPPQTKWKWSYDLRLRNHRTGRELPIEIKKSRVGSRYNQHPNGYLPIIEVVQFRLGTNKQEYLELAKSYCFAKVAQLTSSGLTRGQFQAIEMFEERIDPELDRVFDRLANAEPRDTDYSVRADNNYYPESISSRV